LKGRSAIILEDLPKRVPEHMIEGVKDKQLRLRIYRSAFSAMKNAIVEKAMEFGVPAILVSLLYFYCLSSSRGKDCLPTRRGLCPKGWCL